MQPAQKQTACIYIVTAICVAKGAAYEIKAGWVHENEGAKKSQAAFDEWCNSIGIDAQLLTFHEDGVMVVNMRDAVSVNRLVLPQTAPAPGILPASMDGFGLPGLRG